MPDYYNPNLMSHETFSWSNEMNTFNPPPIFPKPKEEKPPIEELISSCMVETRG